jgi:cobalt-zinc-cadmium efflux system protein
MGHDHQHSNSNIGNAFKIGILINIVFIVVEVVFGILSKSTALLADAGHNLSDVLALAFSWFAILISHRKPNLRFTYGLRRTTILAAIVNTILLIVTVGFIAYEAIIRLALNVQIQGKTVIVVASLGIVVNGFTAYLFMKGKDHDLNIKSSFLHFIADALVSLGVVIAGLAIILTGLTWIDSAVSIIIAIFILYSSYRLLIDSVNLALDAVPKNIDITEVSSYLQSLGSVVSIHDLHIWALSTSETALTVHLVTQNSIDDNLLHDITDYLSTNFNIRHSTIQVEQSNCEKCNNLCN